MKKARYLLEAIIVYIFFFFFKILPVSTASAIGGGIGRKIGPLLATNKKCRRHLKMALNIDDPQKQDIIITQMWDNLGRLFAEYPHLKKISTSYTQVEDKAGLKALIKTNKPAILFGGHIGNWEINGTTLYYQYNKKSALTYRAPNNPWVARLLEKIRTMNGTLEGFPKSRESARHIVKTLKNNGIIGILIDQKHNQGLNIPFFNHPAMTNPVFAQLAQKFDCPLIPFRTTRTHGCHFVITLYPPIATKNPDGSDRNIEDIIIDAHTLMEGWITEKPAQWLWLHRRWKYAKTAQ